MRKNSLFGRVARALGEEEEETSEDIDREVEAAVKAINEMEVSVIDGDSVLGGGWGEAGDMVYIMDLEPIYAVIGARHGRQADNLRETCERVFSQQVERGRGSFESNGYFMRFTGFSSAQGFNQAAIVVNEIGERILGGRFRAMEVPALVVVADVAQITNEDGSLNMEKAGYVVKSGGLPLAMEEPGADDPIWLKERWASPLARPDDPIWTGGSDSEPGAPYWHPTETRPDHASNEEWQEIHHGGESVQAIAGKPKRSRDDWNNRGYQDRRTSFSPFREPDRRVAMDRRGRGF